MTNNKHCRQRGFSLLEVLIALTVMMGAIMVVAMAWSGSQLRIKKMRLNNQAAFLLDYKMSETLLRYKDELTLLPETEEGVFEELGTGYKDFSWSLTSKKFEMPDLTPILMKGQGKAGEGADGMLLMMMGQLTDFFSDAAKEVTVTVIYTFGKKQVKYSANVFMIDFNKQLPLPNLGGAGGSPGGGGAGGGGNGGGGGALGGGIGGGGANN